MRPYLERLAAAAISPGGGFHPIAGALYARPSTPGDGVPSAEPVDSATSPRNPGTKAPPQNVEPRTVLSAEASLRDLPFSNLVQPVTFSPPPTPQRQAALESASPQESLPGAPWPQKQTAAAIPISPNSTPDPSPQSALSTTAKQTDYPASSSILLEDLPSPALGDGARDWSSVPIPMPPEVIFQTTAAEPRGGSTPELSLSASDSTPPKPRDVSPVRANPIISPVFSAAPAAAPLIGPTPDPAVAVFTAKPESIPSASRPSADPSPYHPLVSDYVPPPHAASTTLPRPQSPRAEPLRLTPQELREPDEIQIHIGRIEVTAALPAPAPRPLPAASRSTLSLDNYLRRGNGRA